jgi:hypothetical protein
MRAGADSKVVNLISAQTCISDTTTTGRVDTVGFGYCSIIVGIQPTNTAAMSTIAVSEADTTTTDFTSQAHICGYAGATTYTTIAFTPMTFTNASTSDYTLQEINVDMHGRKRYLNVGITAPDTGAYVFSVARLSDSKIGVDTTTKAGVSAWANG